jgi:hypothetical protein
MARPGRSQASRTLAAAIARTKDKHRQQTHRPLVAIRRDGARRRTLERSARARARLQRVALRDLLDHLLHDEPVVRARVGRVDLAATAARRASASREPRGRERERERERDARPRSVMMVSRGVDGVGVRPRRPLPARVGTATNRCVVWRRATVRSCVVSCGRQRQRHE